MAYDNDMILVPVVLVRRLIRMTANRQLKKLLIEHLKAENVQLVKETKPKKKTKKS